MRLFCCVFLFFFLCAGGYARKNTPAGQIFWTKPCLQSLTGNGITVSWLTHVPVYSWVEYGTDTLELKKARTMLDGQVVCNNYIHKIRLENLEAGETYYYRVCSREILKYGAYSKIFGHTAVSPFYSFRVPGERETDFTALIFNDIHQEFPTMAALCKQIEEVDYDFASLAAISQKKKEFLSSIKEVLDEGDLQEEGPTQPNSLLLDVMSSPSESETNNESSSETENLQEFDETPEVLSEVQTNDTQPENPTPEKDEVDSSTNAADFIEEDRLPEIPKEEALEEAEEEVDLGDLDASLDNEDAEQFGVSGFRALEGEPVIKEEKADIEKGEEEMKQEEHTEEQEQGLDGWFDTKNTPTEKEEVVASKTEEPSEEEKTPKKPNKQASKKGLVGKFNKLEKKEKIFFGVTGAVGVIILILGISTVLSISKALNAPKDNSIKSEKVESKSSKTKSDSSSSKSKSKTSKSSDDTDSNKKYKLSKSQYEDYVSRLSALSGIYINSDGGLGGELKFSDGSTRRIKKFTRDGELIVVDEDKKETTFDKKWVDGLLARLEAEGTSSKESGQSEGSTDKPKEGGE